MLRLESDNVYRADTLSRLEWLDHGFGTRLQSGWLDRARLATLKQIHSDRVLLADEEGVIGEGDALISTQPGLTLSIRTADCLPVLIADTRHRVVGAVHAGWRGVVQEVVPKAIAALAREYGTRTDDLQVAVGPGIGACCFEVGPEVAVQFAGLFPERDDLATRTKIDLREAVLRQLGRLGVPQGQIASSDLCTYCDKDTFHSYRRDREGAGRMVSAIQIRDMAP